MSDSAYPWSEQIPGQDDPRKRPLALNLPGLMGGLASFPKGTPPPTAPPESQPPLGDALRNQQPSGSLAVDTGMTGAPSQPAQPSSGPLADFMTKNQQPQLHGIKKVLDVLGQFETPGLEQAIPGTPGNYRRQYGLAVQQQGDFDRTQQSEATVADTQSQTRLRDAQAKKALTEKTPSDPKTVDTAEGVKQYNEDTGRYDILVGGPKTTAGKPTFEEQTYEEWKQANPKGTRMQFDAEQARNKQAPEKPQRTLVAIPQPDGNSKLIEAGPGTIIPKGAQTVSEFGKPKQPTADEARRGDLANNLSENLDKLEEIATRRPDLFGPFAGRLTKGKQWYGASDPDVAALQTIQEQTGMAMVGTHAMRNAQHVEAAANSIMNAYKNEPSALLGPNGSIAAARASLKTFTDDVEKARGGGAAPTAAPTKSNDPLGIR